MVDEQIKMLDDIVRKRIEATQLLSEYWNLYSNIGTWQFWVLTIFILVLPLVILYFTIDRGKIFLIGFYGFSINIWLTLGGEIGVNRGWWDYPYMTFSFLPISFSILSSAIPVIFMLVFQWTLNHNKNFYIYSLFAAILTAFIFAPLMVSLDFFRLHNGTNYFHILLLYTILFLVSKFILNAFLYMQNKVAE